jgi:histidine triad (HIT) family protein
MESILASVAAYDPNNIFAKILRGEIPALKVLEDEHALAFMDIMPWSEGHTLVIPKVAARNLFEVPPPALARLIERTQVVAQAVQKAFKPDGLRLVQNNEPTAGQTVFHLHFHIVPCYEGVPLRINEAKMADQAVLRGYADRIRKELA